jgi:hypothetical protein
MATKLWLELNDVPRIFEACEKFVRHYGETHCAAFGVSMPQSAHVRLLDIQFDFAGYRDRCLRKHFSSAIWTVERQTDTRDWHVHALVYVGFNIQAGFPFEAIRRKDYSQAPQKIRKLWKSLREAASATGYGISNIMPVEAGSLGRLVTYNRPHLLPIEPNRAERYMAYMSGRSFTESKNWKQPPEGCGSWKGGA